VRDRGEIDCGNCPLDPCKLLAHECSAFMGVIEVFNTLTGTREAVEYLHRPLEETANE